MEGFGGIVTIFFRKKRRMPYKSCYPRCEMHIEHRNTYFLVKRKTSHGNVDDFGNFRNQTYIALVFFGDVILGHSKRCPAK